MPRVADNGVAQVRQVAADLMSSPGLGVEFDIGVACCCVATSRIRKLNCGDPPIAGLGLLRLLALDMPVLILVLIEWRIYRSRFGDVSAGESSIRLMHFAFLKLHAKGGAGFIVQSEEQNSRGGAVYAVGRVYHAAYLVSQQLDGETCFAAVNGTAVNE